MTALILSDLHAHAWTRFATTLPDGTNSRFGHLLGVLGQAELAIRRSRPDSLIVLGDVTHRRHFVHFAVYNRLMAELNRLRGLVARGVMVVGNHDFESVGVHSLAPFAYAGWDVVDAPRWLPEGYFVPWMPGDEVPKAASRPLPHRGAGDPPDNIFLHYALDGHVLDSEYALPSPLRIEHLSEYGKIVMGHVHSPAVERSGRVVYVGAAMHLDFGDAGDRYCWLMDTESGCTEKVRLDAPKFCTARFPKVPAPAEEGFLRVVGVPRDRLADVREQALACGWLDAVTVEAEVPVEAAKALSSEVMVDVDVMRRHVARQLPDLDEEGRAAVVEFGLDCLGERNARA